MSLMDKNKDLNKEKDIFPKLMYKFSRLTLIKHINFELFLELLKLVLKSIKEPRRK